MGIIKTYIASSTVVILGTLVLSAFLPFPHPISLLVYVLKLLADYFHHTFSQKVEK